jgi:hypothetical protein
MRHTEGFFPEDSSTPKFLLETTVLTGENASIDREKGAEKEKDNQTPCIKMMTPTSSTA